MTIADFRVESSSEVICAEKCFKCRNLWPCDLILLFDLNNSKEICYVEIDENFKGKHTEVLKWPGC